MASSYPITEARMEHNMEIEMVAGIYLGLHGFWVYQVITR